MAAYRGDVQGPVGAVLHPKGKVDGNIGRLASAVRDIARLAVAGQIFDAVGRIRFCSNHPSGPRGNGTNEADETDEQADGPHPGENQRFVLRWSSQDLTESGAANEALRRQGES